MRSPILNLTLTACALIAAQLGLAQPLQAQMVTTQMPLQGNSTSFYEQSHIGWSIHNPHYFINFNGGGGVPPFGGFQPNAGMHTGFAVGHDHFDFGFSQGASINSTSISPMLTTTNGFPGLLFVGSERPFVTGVVPQVGGGFFSVPPQGPLTSRMASGEFRMENRRLVPAGADVAVRRTEPAAVNARAEQPAPGPVPETRAIKPKSSVDLTAAQYLERGDLAVKEGRRGAAKIYYQLAATKGDLLVQSDARTRLEALKAGTPATP